MSIKIGNTTVTNIIVKDSSGNILCSDVKLVTANGTSVFRKDTTVTIQYCFYWEESSEYTECGQTSWQYYPSDPYIYVNINSQAKPISSISFSGYIDLYEENSRIVNNASGSKGSLSSSGIVTLSGDKYWTRGYSYGAPAVKIKSTLTGTITFTDGSTYTFTIPDYSGFYADDDPVVYYGAF